MVRYTHDQLKAICAQMVATDRAAVKEAMTRNGCTEEVLAAEPLRVGNNSFMAAREAFSLSTAHADAGRKTIIVKVGDVQVKTPPSDASVSPPRNVSPFRMSPAPEDGTGGRRVIGAGRGRMLPVVMTSMPCEGWKGFPAGRGRPGSVSRDTSDCVSSEVVSAATPQLTPELKAASPLLAAGKLNPNAREFVPDAEPPVPEPAWGVPIRQPSPPPLPEDNAAPSAEPDAGEWTPAETEGTRIIEKNAPLLSFVAPPAPTDGPSPTTAHLRSILKEATAEAPAVATELNTDAAEFVPAAAAGRAASHDSVEMGVPAVGSAMSLNPMASAQSTAVDLADYATPYDTMVSAELTTAPLLKLPSTSLSEGGSRPSSLGRQLNTDAKEFVPGDGGSFLNSDAQEFLPGAEYPPTAMGGKARLPHAMQTRRGRRSPKHHDAGGLPMSSLYRESQINMHLLSTIQAHHAHWDAVESGHWGHGGTYAGQRGYGKQHAMAGGYGRHGSGYGHPRDGAPCGYAGGFDSFDMNTHVAAHMPGARRGGPPPTCVGSSGARHFKPPTTVNG